MPSVGKCVELQCLGHWDIIDAVRMTGKTTRDLDKADLTIGKGLVAERGYSLGEYPPLWFDWRSRRIMASPPISRHQEERAVMLIAFDVGEQLLLLDARGLVVLTAA